MFHLIESNDFGDWLVGAISETSAQSRSANFQEALHARLRLEALKTAKKVLLEYLLIQQSMLDAARAARMARSNGPSAVSATLPGKEQPRVL